MVLKKYLLILLLSVSTLFAQNLFFTDSYQTNIYQDNTQRFIFNNNIFGVMEGSDQTAIKALFNEFFQEAEIIAEYVPSQHCTQFEYTFSSHSNEPLRWSRLWHSTYESQLKLILNDFIRTYYADEIAIPSTIKDAAIKKQAYYVLKNYKDRVNDYAKTNISLSLKDVNVKKFKENHIAPNLSLNRIVTNSFYSYYNEVYPVMEVSEPTYFILGPNNKSRLQDCFSMHLFTKLNQLPEPVYLCNYSVIVLDSIEQNALISEAFIQQYGKEIISQLKTITNSLDYSFYNVHDIDLLEDLLDNYTLKDYEKFIEVYLKMNSYNVAAPLSDLENCYNKSILESEVNFKQNSHYFLAQNDSLILNSLAKFLVSNPSVELIIHGYAGASEYTKIDKEKFNDLLEKYKEYTPVKSSKNAELSIYRAVIVFDYLFQKGVDPTKLQCISKSIKNAEEAFAKVDFSIK